MTIFENNNNGFSTIKGNNTGEIKIKFLSSPQEDMQLTITKDSLLLKRENSTTANIVIDKFYGTQQAPRYSDDSGLFELQVYIDESSIEVFADEGKSVMTALYFFDAPINKVIIEGNKASITSGTWGHITKQ